MDFGDNLLKICKEKGVTISQLSRLSGVKQPTLHGWTTGRAVKKIEDLKKICEVLNVSLYYMLFNRSDPYERLDQSKVLEEMFKGEVCITIQRAIK
jgi:transcriptional regulator with XRE-family HTH domain